jgi:hypothetical protein
MVGKIDPKKVPDLPFLSPRPRVEGGGGREVGQFISLNQVREPVPIMDAKKVVQDGKTVPLARPVIDSYVDQLFKLGERVLLEEEEGGNKISAA